MKISKTSEYAIRILAFLAASSKIRTSREISKNLTISHKYVGKILMRMVHHKLLFSKKGHGGGFGLALPPSEIYLADIIDMVDGMAQFNSCLLGSDLCGEKLCRFHVPWEKINRDIRELFETCSLESLVSGQKNNQNKMFREKK